MVAWRPPEEVKRDWPAVKSMGLSAVKVERAKGIETGRENHRFAQVCLNGPLAAV